MGTEAKGGRKDEYNLENVEFPRFVGCSGGYDLIGSLPYTSGAQIRSLGY